MFVCPVGGVILVNHSVQCIEVGVHRTLKSNDKNMWNLDESVNCTVPQQLTFFST